MSAASHGCGMTTLLRNIITQDLMRLVGPANGRRKIPIVIFDGKGATVLPKLASSREESEGANLRFKDQKLAAMVPFPRRR